MASSGLLLLLLVSSSFLICSLSAAQPSDLQETRSLQKRGMISKAAKTAADYFSIIATTTKPFIGLIPIVGGPLNFIMDVTDKVVAKKKSDDLQKFIKMEFDNLNRKIDDNHKELKWDISKIPYGKLETKINVAWNNMKDMLKKFPEQSAESLKNHKDDFKNAKKYLDELHYYITKNGLYNPEYVKLLTDQVKCHSKSIRMFSAVNAALMYKAITMAYFHNKINGLESDMSDLADKAHAVSATMFKIQVNCISDPKKYLEEEVKGIMARTKNKNDLAKLIREFLDSTHDSYDWMVVVFKTSNSKTFLNLNNKHILTGFFIVAEKGGISVAAAKQAKGTHTKTAQVVKAIKDCVKGKVPCDDVGTTLEKCDKAVDGTKVNDTYSSIHAYTKDHDKRHDSVNAQEAAEAPSGEFLTPEEERKIPFVYTGECSYFTFGTRHFRVLIKSDEELMSKDPCKNVDCGEKENRGKCIQVKDEHIGLCECDKGYYGEKCEKSMEDYKKAIISKDMIE